MTEQETIKVVTLIVMSYPATEKFKDEDSVKAMVSVWKQMFKDDNPRLVELAVQKHIATSKWPPNIAEIREQMVSLEHPEIIPPDVAWAAVCDLLDGTGMFSSYRSELPPLIERCIEIVGWSHLKEVHRGHHGGYKPGLDRLTFIQQYTPMYEREREKAMLPKSLSEAVTKTEKMIGGEAYRMLETAHQTRIDEENKWNRIINRDYERRLEEREQRLLGGNEDV